MAALEDRPDVAEEVRGGYRHFVVDEYQDVNPLQQRLLELWLGDRDDLCVVGDASQTIYSFTGASSSYLLDFPQRWPGAEVVRLVRDYRSTPQVVALANRVLAGAEGAAGRRGSSWSRSGPRARSRRSPATTTRAPRRRASPRGSGRCSAGRMPAGRGRHALPDQRPVGGLRGGPRRRAASPTCCAARERFFERPEVREAVILLLRGAAPRGARRRAGRLRDDVAAVLPTSGWDPALPSHRGRAPGALGVPRRARPRSPRTSPPPEPTAGLRDWSRSWTSGRAAQHAPTVEGVTLASLHAAKGLEWDAVFLVGLVEGTVPIIHAETPRTPSRRSVGCSTSASPVPASTCSCPGRAARYARAARQPAALPLPRRPGACRGASGRTQPGAGGRRRGAGPTCAAMPAARCSSAARIASAVGARLSAGLRRGALRPAAAWRLERSRADSVPAYVVLTDATLEAVATRRPDRQGALVSIPGIGAAKVERYGEALLDLVAGRDVSVAASAKITES